MNRLQLVFTQLALMKRLEAPLARAIVKEKNRYVKDAAASWALTGRLPDRAFEEHERNLRGIISGAALTTVTRFGKLSAQRMKCGCRFLEMKGDDGLISDRTFNRLAQTWVGKYGALKVVGMARTTRDDLRRALLAGEEEGATTQQLRGRLQAVAQLSYFRASTIARTETHNTAMFATAGVAQIIAQETGAQLTKEWLAVEDERTRMSHAEADGQTVDLGGTFQVGGEMLAYPGDPMGSAENVINCRCVQAVEEV